MARLKTPQGEDGKEYIILAARHMVIVTNDKDKITKQYTLTRGDKVVLSEEDAERLVRTGGVIPADAPIPPLATVEGQFTDASQASQGLAITDPANPSFVNPANPDAANERFSPNGEGAPAPSLVVTPGALSGQTADEGAAEGQDAITERQETGEQGTLRHPSPDYSAAEWTYPVLQATAKERGLGAGGSKEEIVARLVEDDEKKAAKAVESSKS